MRTLKWMVTASLLVSLSAVAQQPADSQSTSQPATIQMSAPAEPAQGMSQPATAHVPSPAPAANAQPAPPQAGPQPTTMDQVVDRFIDAGKGPDRDAADPHAR